MVIWASATGPTSMSHRSSTLRTKDEACVVPLDVAVAEAEYVAFCPTATAARQDKIVYDVAFILTRTRDDSEIYRGWKSKQTRNPDLPKPINHRVSSVKHMASSGEKSEVMPCRNKSLPKQKEEGWSLT